jgi:trehalose 6-phosphate synthase
VTVGRQGNGGPRLDPIARRGRDRIVVLANREPFRHEMTPDGVSVVRSASGLVTALEPLVEACQGVWVAHGAGNADRLVVECRDGLNVPPANPRYRLRRVWLSDADVRGYYYGFSNEGLWPLCHATRVRPVFRPGDFATYRTVNALFAAAACDEAISAHPVVLVQDYHFALAPRIIRRRLPASTVVTFWHIPWPAPQVFESCPWSRKLIDGLLGSDIVGFQTGSAVTNFRDAVDVLLGDEVEWREDSVTYRDHETRIRTYPVGVEWPNPIASVLPDARACRQAVSRTLHLADGMQLVVGVDRLDYTKGLNEKLLAIENLLDRRDDFRGRFVFVQIAEPSRNCLPAYRAVRAEIVDTAARINVRFGRDAHQPVVLLESHHDAPDVYRLLRAADVCYVGSLDDGMNLVAKEFVSARQRDDGVLVLSQFTGAAEQLGTALHVNPYDVERAADILAEALRMPLEEQSRRMRSMRAVVAQFNATWWARRMLEDAAQIRRAQQAKSAAFASAPQEMTA